MNVIYMTKSHMRSRQTENDCSLALCKEASRLAKERVSLSKERYELLTELHECMAVVQHRKALCSSTRGEILGTVYERQTLRYSSR